MRKTSCPGEPRLQSPLERFLGAHEDEVDGQHHAGGVFHEVGHVRIEDGDPVEVAVEGQRAGVAEMETVERPESEALHEGGDLGERWRSSDNHGLRCHDGEAGRLFRHPFQPEVIAEQLVLEQQTLKVFQRQCDGEFWQAACFGQSDDDEPCLAGMSGLEDARPVRAEPNPMFLTAGRCGRNGCTARNQAAVLTRPRDEVAGLASAEQRSCARRIACNWAWNCAEVTRG